MSNPNTEPRSARSGFRTPAGGWKRAACLLPAVLACAFAGAGQAQTVYRGGLDEAVDKLTRQLVNEAGLAGKRVLVKSDDFREMRTELRLKLSEMLRGLSEEGLTRHGALVARAGSDENAVHVLQGRWRRQPDRHLHLELSVVAPARSGGPTGSQTVRARGEEAGDGAARRSGGPTGSRTVRGLVPIDESIEEAIESTVDDWGRLLVLRLDSGARGQQKRTVHLQPIAIGGDEGQGDELRGFLGGWLGSALVGSRLFTLVEPPPGETVETDGKLYVESILRAGRVQVILKVLDNGYRRVAFAQVEMDQGLLPPGIFPDPSPGGGGSTVDGPRLAPDALHRAAETGDLAGLQRALASVTDVDARDDKGWTALMHAVAKGYPVVVEPLLDAGADPDVRAPNGATALFMAASEGHVEIIERLMEAEADVSLRGPRGRMAAEVARERYGDADTARRNGEPLAVLALLGGMFLDDATFARAEASGTAGAYAEYRSQYPQGRHSEEAGRRERERTAGRRFRDCGECPKMVVVGPGSFIRGSGEELHRVTIARPFAVGVYEVTRGEYARFVSETGRSMGDTCGTYEGTSWDHRSGRNWRDPAFEQTDEHPVVCVSWDEAQGYVRWLSRETGEIYRLLSESEWEYVTRAGKRTAHYWGESGEGHCRYANGADEALKRRYADWPGYWPWSAASCDDGHTWTSPVGSFGANSYGLRDVLGNVAEWVEDCMNGSYDSYRGSPRDGSARSSGECGARMVRGGSWSNFPNSLRSAYCIRSCAGFRQSYIGFRVAQTLTP